MKLLDYKKRAQKYDQDTENITVEKVEEKVLFQILKLKKVLEKLVIQSAFIWGRYKR